MQTGFMRFLLADIRILRYSGTEVNRVRKCQQMNGNLSPTAHLCRSQIGHRPRIDAIHSFHVIRPPKPRMKNRSELRSSGRRHLCPLEVPAGHLPADASAKTGEVCRSACAAAGCRPQYHFSLGMGSIARICISGCRSSGARAGWKPAPTIRHRQSLHLCAFAVRFEKAGYGAAGKRNLLRWTWGPSHGLVLPLDRARATEPRSPAEALHVTYWKHPIPLLVPPPRSS